MPANFSLIYGYPSLLDRLMNQTGQYPALALHAMSAWHFPPLQIFEDEDTLYVRAIVPGVPLENVTLTLESGMLVLRGVIPRLPGRHLRCERPTGPFKREIPLPFPVDAARVSAVVQYGLLTVTIPRCGENKKRTIPVQTEAGPPS